MKVGEYYLYRPFWFCEPWLVRCIWVSPHPQWREFTVEYVDSCKTMECSPGLSSLFTRVSPLEALATQAE